MTKKKCVICNKEKPATTEFFCVDKSMTSGLHSYCKECHRLKGRTRYESKKEYLNKLNSEWKKNNKDKRFAEAIKYKYGLSIEDYNKLFNSQNGVCAICKREEKKKNYGKTQGLSIDHNHSTGKVRGLLCHRCNTLVGQRESFLANSVDEYLIKNN